MPSQSKEGATVRVTRTLLGEYVQRGDEESTTRAVSRTLVLVALAAGCAFAGGRCVRRFFR